MAYGKAASKFYTIISCIVLLLLTALWKSGNRLEDLRTVSLPTRGVSNRYVYKPAPNVTISGLPFHTSRWQTKRPSSYLDIDSYDLRNFKFVTAASSNHFRESKDLIASIQKVFPHKKIYYYDIGLKETEIRELKSWCSVIYRKWNFRLYPKHIQHFYSCAFKPLIIHEAIQEFGAVFWLDASGRLSPNVSQSNWNSVYETARKSGGFVQFAKTGRDIFQCTAKGMYRYLPGNEEKLQHFEMLGAGMVLLYRTKTIFNGVIRWWRLCALTKDCIEPRGHKHDCGKGEPGVSICHRYDQSALNILVANMLAYEDNRLPKGKPLIEVHRRPTNLYNLTICTNRKN